MIDRNVSGVPVIIVIRFSFPYHTWRNGYANSLTDRLTTAFLLMQEIDGG
jgi:hypothetical protein